jgi:redox-sensitive bicupin YhaK (pirin superfamily)
MFMSSQTQKHKARRIERVVRGIPSSENSGARLNRVIGTEALDQVDPFLLFEEMRSGAVFGDLVEHPCAGFEIITCVMQGVAWHSTAGKGGMIPAGGAQWLTAGCGVSQGLSLGGDGAFGFQLWLNLPGEDKRQQAVARDIAAEDVPALIVGKAEARVLAGRLQGLMGPITSSPTQPVLIDVTMGGEGDISLPLPKDHQGFVYVFKGGVAVEQTLISAGQAGLLNADGDTLNLAAGQDGARALVATALPLKEPLVRYGPFVMNDHDGIKQAFTDYQNGLF